MLRLPPTTIQLSHRDLQWHYRRSEIRMKCKERHATQLYLSNITRDRTATVQALRPVPSCFPANLPGFPAEPGRRCSDVQNWGHTLIGNLYDASAHAHFSPLEADDYSDASDVSDVATTISSDQFSNDHDVTSVPVSIDPNVRAADEIQAQLLRAATHSHVDGTSDVRNAHQPSEFSWLVPYRRLTSDERPHRQVPVPFSIESERATYHSSSQNTGSIMPQLSMLSRLRHVSDTAPLLGSPLRFSEAARSNSPERLTARTIFATGAAIQDRRIGLLRLPDRTPLIGEVQGESTRMPSIEEPPASPAREQLESFSPISHAEMQRIHASLFGSDYLIRPQQDRDDLESCIVCSLSDSKDAQAASPTKATDEKFFPLSNAILVPSFDTTHVPTPSGQASTDGIPLAQTRHVVQSLSIHQDAMGLDKPSEAAEDASKEISMLEDFEAGLGNCHIHRDDDINPNLVEWLSALGPSYALDAFQGNADQENHRDEEANEEPSNMGESQHTGDLLETPPIQRTDTHRR